MGKYETNYANLEYGNYEKEELKAKYDSRASFLQKSICNTLK